LQADHGYIPIDSQQRGIAAVVGNNGMRELMQAEYIQPKKTVAKVMVYLFS